MKAISKAIIEAGRHMLIICLFTITPSVMAAELGGLVDQASKMASDSLGGLLGSQLDISSDQAEGGLGGLFSLAKNQLSAGDFESLTAAVPGVSGYLDKARELGLLDQPVNSVGDLTNALSSLGLDAETIEQFLPTAVEAIGTIGGDQARALLSPLLGS
jgi:hypothetical protein